jgi:hypothetical protein
MKHFRVDEMTKELESKTKGSVMESSDAQEGVSVICNYLRAIERPENEIEDE